MSLVSRYTINGFITTLCVVVFGSWKQWFLEFCVIHNIRDVSEADLKIDVGVFYDVHKALSHHQQYVNFVSTNKI